MPVSPTGYTVEALAFNVTILEIILVLVGFILAALRGAPRFVDALLGHFGTKVRRI